VGEAISRSRSEKLDFYLQALYELLRDLLVIALGSGDVRNQDIRRDLEALADRITFDWVRAAVRRVDETAELIRRNIQKTIALDALIVALRKA
jgi:DNA polymerase-3 subunit delta'